MANQKKGKGFVKKIKRDVKLVKAGTATKKILSDYVIPIGLLVFAAAAYYLYDVPIPESKSKKVSKAKKKALKDPESQKVYLN